MTYLQAALTILTYADRPLSVGELTVVALTHGLLHPRGRTPDRSMSSILYRRLASDPDAPLTCLDGRFWLRGRAPVAALPRALRPAVRQVRHDRHSHAPRHEGAAHPRRPMRLPDPIPVALPENVLPLPVPVEGGGRGGQVERLAARLARLAARRPAEEVTQAWDAERTLSRLVAPLLTQLGYRRADLSSAASGRGRAARLLLAGTADAMLIEVTRAGHAIEDGDARSTLARAAALGVRWALLTNGTRLRLYAVTLAGAHESAGARLLAIDLADPRREAMETDVTHLLTLLTRAAVGRGALDAYLAARAVGAALLAACEDPGSALVEALARAVREATGLDLPRASIARQARLAVRGERDRDGAPLPVDAPMVAALGRVEAARAQDARASA